MNIFIFIIELRRHLRVLYFNAYVNYEYTLSHDALLKLIKPSINKNFE